MVLAVACTFTFVLILKVVRDARLAVVLLAAAAAPAMTGIMHPPPLELLMLVTAVVWGSVLFIRFGLLATAAVLLLRFIVALPLTLDVHAWFFGSSFAVICLVIGAAAYAAFIAAGGGATTPRAYQTAAIGEPR